jgi:hypothetical protein
VISKALESRSGQRREFRTSRIGTLGMNIKCQNPNIK